MKTAISMPDELFEELATVAKEEKRSRSGILAEAVREFLETRKSRKLLAALNEAYSEPETSEEKAARRASRRSYSRTLRREKW